MIDAHRIWMGTACLWHGISMIAMLINSSNCWQIWLTLQKQFRNVLRIELISIAQTLAVRRAQVHRWRSIFQLYLVKPVGVDMDQAHVVEILDLVLLQRQ